eukprot:CAMPEP_0174828270 /NCGR_PEP_ID=MMETSP1114-20130205/1228_1 /TAXON_ID=312471 /ORGANISM="Neobodo designis, Strain CCAP 1951/1" /LENGTH=204 /DNA_ID=CAMNT_0016061983 /DNA_START=53 /DNA_END=667 /DNA_ORIENTATION=+
MALPSITFVTGNKGKLTEVQAMLAGIATVDAVKVDLPELQGDPLEVAKEKAVTAFATLQRPCMVEDTSLCFHALNDLPGPYIKWFLDKCGHEGLNKMLDGFEDRGAHAMCIFTVAESADKADVKCYVGRCEGTIVRPRGPGGFGWDPVFCPKEGPEGKTFAEMSADEKNAISHRKRALDALKTRFRAAAGDANAAASEKKRERE